MEIKGKAVGDIVADVVRRRARDNVLAADVQSSVIDRSRAVRIGEISALFRREAEIVIAHAVLSRIVCVFKLVLGDRQKLFHIAFVRLRDGKYVFRRTNLLVSDFYVRDCGVNAHRSLYFGKRNVHLLRRIVGHGNGYFRCVDEREHFRLGHAVFQFALQGLPRKDRLSDIFDARHGKLVFYFACKVCVSEFTCIYRADGIILPVFGSYPIPHDVRRQRRVIGKRERRGRRVELGKHLLVRHADVERAFRRVVLPEGNVGNAFDRL